VTSFVQYAGILLLANIMEFALAKGAKAFLKGQFKEVLNMFAWPTEIAL